MGVLFLVSILLTVGLGLVTGFPGREIYLVVWVDVGISFVQMWVRLEIVRSNIDLLNNLQKYGPIFEK